VRNGKAAGERMHRLFRSRNISAMPYVEVYLGAQLEWSQVVYSGKVDFLADALRGAQVQLRSAVLVTERKQRLQFLSALRQRRRAGRHGEDGTAGEGTTRPDAAVPAGRPRVPPDPGRLGLAQHLLRVPSPRQRGSPQRGATGGRRKGWR